MKDIITKVLQKTVGKNADFDVLIPEREEFGHYSTNVALKLAKAEKKNPLEIAGQIVAKIEKTAPRKFFEKIEIANPGFINFWLSQEILQRELWEILKKEEHYGKKISRKAHGKKVIVEFTDPNPFKEFHIGHLYSNIVGETLARLFEANGARVKRANYQGDVGIHVAKAVWGMKKMMEADGATLKELARKPLRERIKFMGKAYAMGDAAYAAEGIEKIEITALNGKIFALARPNSGGGGSDPEIEGLYRNGRKWSLEYFETIYKRLGTKFDLYYFERDVADNGVEIVKKNLKRGIFEESDGAVVFPGTRYGLHTRVFINSNGLPTYEAKELGLAPMKYKDFPYDRSFIVTGSDIIDYFKVLLAALGKINPKLAEKTRHIAHGHVRFAEGKMSSRTGNVITAEQLLDAMKARVAKIVKSSKRKFPKRELEAVIEGIAVGAARYSFLKTGVGQDIIFDFDTSLSLKGDSGPYLQYTYARLKSVVRKAVRLRLPQAGAAPKKPDFPLLGGETEQAVVRTLIHFPEVIERAAARCEPNALTEYLHKLADALNSFYEREPILKAPKPLREARLGLVIAAAAVLKSGLGILGIKALEKI